MSEVRVIRVLGCEVWVKLGIFFTLKLSTLKIN